MPVADPANDPAPLRPPADGPPPSRELADLPPVPARPILREAKAPFSSAAAAPGHRESGDPAQTRGLLPREQKKFFKLGFSPSAEQRPAGAEKRSAAGLTLLPRRADSVEQRTGGRRRSFNRRQRQAILGFGVLALVGSFLVGFTFGWLAHAPPPAPEPTPSAPFLLPSGTLSPETWSSPPPDLGLAPSGPLPPTEAKQP